MLAEGPAGGVLPADFDEAVTMLPGRHDPLAATHHRRHRRVLTRALAQIEICRGDGLVPAAAWVIPIPVSSLLPVAAASTLLERDDPWLVDRFARLRVPRRDHRLRGYIAGEDVAFEVTVADPVPAVLYLAVDRNRRALRQL